VRIGLPVAILLASTVACSNGNASPPAAGTKAPAASAATGTTTGNACDHKWIQQADVDGILSDPVTSMGPLQGDPQTCLFKTANFASIRIATRPGLGKTTLDAWSSGRMGLSATPLSGIGDQAVWQDTLKEINATKGDLLCDVGIDGPPGSTKLSTADLQKRLGGLCTKIFAAQ
jgi:hypothetical protein